MTKNKENGYVRWGNFIPFLIITVTILLAIGGWTITGFARNNDDHGIIKDKIGRIETEICTRLAKIETNLDYLRKEQEGGRYGR